MPSFNRKKKIHFASELIWGLLAAGMMILAVYLLHATPSVHQRLDSGGLVCKTIDSKVFEAPTKLSERFDLKFGVFENDCYEKSIRIKIPQVEKSNNVSFSLFVPFIRGATSIEAVLTSGKKINFFPSKFGNEIMLVIDNEIVKELLIPVVPDKRMSIRFMYSTPAIGTVNQVNWLFISYGTIAFFIWIIMFLISFLFSIWFFYFFLLEKEQGVFLYASLGLMLNAIQVLFLLFAPWQDYPIFSSVLIRFFEIIGGTSLFILLSSFYFIGSNNLSIREIINTKTFKFCIGLFVSACLVGVSFYLGFKELATAIGFIACYGSSYILVLLKKSKSTTQRLAVIIGIAIYLLYALAIIQQFNLLVDRMYLGLALKLANITLTIFVIFYFIGYYQNLLAEKANRARLKDQFDSYKVALQTVVHDIQQPFDAIQASFLLALKEMKLAKKKQEDFKKTLKRLVSRTVEEREYLSSVIETAKDISTTSQLDCSHFSISEIFKFDALTYKTSSAVYTPSFELAEDKIIYGDKNRLKRMMRNLVQNAVRATNGKTHIKLSVEKHKTCNVLRLMNTNSVIPKNIISNVFKLGFSRNNSSGIGLFIVEGIVLAHEGKISAKNISSGVEFSIQLPHKKEEI